MPRTPPHLTLMLVAAACGGERTSAAAPPTAVVKVLDDTVLSMTLTVTGPRCDVTGAAEVAISRDGASTVARMGETKTLTMGPGVTGIEVSDADDTSRLRYARGDHRIDLLTMEGVALVRIVIAADGQSATLVDAARSPLGRVWRLGPDVVFEDRDGAHVGEALGANDVEVGALLAAPGVPPDVRALLACDRLLPASSAPASFEPAPAPESK